MALKKLKNRSDEERKRSYEWELTTLKALRNPLSLDIKKLKEYEGIYGPMTIMLEGDKLYYQKTGFQKYALIPMGQDLLESQSYPILE